ncbi:MAG: two-component regulator propeller domain-containing protein [Chitinophagaceae bacterium]
MLRIVKGLTVLLLLLPTLFRAAAQAPVLYFDRISQANGLSNNKVNCFLQDRRGFMWIGTDDGLNRFDGTHFQVFKHVAGDTTGLSGNTITDLLEDSTGVIWISTADGGLTRYDAAAPGNRQFRQYRHQPGNAASIPVNIIHAIEADADGYIWLATGGASVIRFDPEKELFTSVHPQTRGTIYDLCFDDNHILWAGREGGSIIKINPQTLESRTDQRYNNLYAALPHMVVTNLFRDSKQNIWFGSWDKALYLQQSGAEQEQKFEWQPNRPGVFGLDEARAIGEDRNGYIWVGGKKSGLYLFDPARNFFYNYRHDPARDGTIGSNTINCIYTDRQGLMWIGTSNGISLYRPNLLPFQQEFLPREYWTDGTGPEIFDFWKREDGTLWIGTSVGLIVRQANGSYQHHALEYRGRRLAVTKFHSASDGQLYLGTDYSVFRFNEKNRSLSLLPNTESDAVMSRLIESRVVSMADDSICGRPVLLVAPYGHFLAWYDWQEQRWVSRMDSVSAILDRFEIRDNLIRKLLRTRNGQLWMAQAKDGLALVKKNTRGKIQYINDPSVPNTISNNHVFDLAEDPAGNLWVSTYGGGLNHFDLRKRTFSRFSSTNNITEGLSIDRMGRIWVVSSGHLQLFDPIRGSFQYAELPDLERSGGVRGYIYQDQKGAMYVAGSGYYIQFDPTQIKLRQQPPRVQLTDISIFNQSHSQLLSQDEIVLTERQNFFTLHFAAPYFQTSLPVQYQYMLVGLHEDWVAAGTATQALFTNLTGGDYVFKVRASTGAGGWSDQITQLRIRIVPPFWKETWFYVICTLFASLLIFVAYRYRVAELLKRQAIRNKIAQDLHDNMGSTLSSISVYSQVARIYHKQQKQEQLDQTLEKISATSGEMISEMNDIVWAINPRNDNMNTILQRMESFARPLLAVQGINFHFFVQESVRQQVLEMTPRKNFYLIFKEAINNALKYADCKNIWVTVERKQHRLRLTVRDDGRGFDQHAVPGNNLAGNGLANMRMRAKEIRGRLELLSQPGRGTELILEFG